MSDFNLADRIIQACVAAEEMSRGDKGDQNPASVSTRFIRSVVAQWQKDVGSALSDPSSDWKIVPRDAISR